MKNILSMCHLLFITVFIKETREETCKTHNTQFTNLYSVVSEPFKLPLLEYFSGEGIQYEVSNLPSTYLLEQITPNKQTNSLPYTNVVAMTVEVNSGDPNLPTNQYVVLTSNETDYTIYVGEMMITNKSQAINLNQFINSIPIILSTNETQYCFGIDFVEKYILVSCMISNSTSSQTTEVFYVTSAGSQNALDTIEGTQVINSTFISVTGQVQVIQIYGKYYIANIFNGVNSIGNVSSGYTYYSLDLTLKSVKNQYLYIFSEEDNQYVDVFVSTSGDQFLLTSDYLTVYNEFISFNSAQSLGVFELQVQPEKWIYLIAVAVPDGVFITDDYFVNSRFLQAPIVDSEFVDVYIDPYYVTIATNKGVSVYPSYENHVNKDKNLYSDSIGIAGSAYNVQSHTLTVIANDGSQIIYQLTNPFITGYSSTAYNNYSLTVQQSNSASTTPCSVTFNISVVPSGNAAQIYPKFQTVPYLLYIPYSTVLTANTFLQGPAIQIQRLNTTQYFYYDHHYDSSAPIYSQNFIRSHGWTQQEFNPFNPFIDISENQLFQVIQNTLGEIALLQVDPFTNSYKLIANYTLQTNESIVQFSIGMEGYSYEIGALFANGSAVIVDSYEQYHTFTPPAGSYVQQIEILDDYVYLVVETYEEDEGVVTDEIQSSTLYVYDYQSMITKIPNVVQISQKINAYGQLLFLNKVNQIVIGKLIDQAFVNYITVSTPLTATLPNNPDLIPQLELTEDGMYFITNTTIYFMPRQVFLNADSQIIDQPWITIPLYGYQITIPIIASSSLLHLYIVVGNHYGNKMFVYSNPQNLMDVLYFCTPTTQDYYWLNVVGIKQFDWGTIGFPGFTEELAGDFILYPKQYVLINTTELINSSYGTYGYGLNFISMLTLEFQIILMPLYFIDLGQQLYTLNPTDSNTTLVHSSLTQVDLRDYFLGNIYNLTVRVQSGADYNIAYQAPLTNLTQGNTVFLNSTVTSAVRWYANSSDTLWTIIVNNTYVYLTFQVNDELEIEIEYDRFINLTEEFGLEPDAYCPFIFVDDEFQAPIIICALPSYQELSFYIYDSGRKSFPQVGTYQLQELSSQNIISVEILFPAVLIIKMTTSTPGQYQFTTLLMQQQYFTELIVYQIGNPLYGDSTMTPFALQSTLYNYPVYQEAQYGFIYVQQSASDNDTTTKTLQVLTISVNVEWNGVTAINNTIQETSLQNLLREYHINETSTNFIQFITVIGLGRQLFTNTYVPIVITTVQTSFQIDLVFSQSNGLLVDANFNCFYQGITGYSPNAAVGGNGMFIPYYRIENSIQILNYGQTAGHCQDQNIMTTLEVFTQTDFNGEYLQEVTQFQLLTTNATLMIFITFANQTSNFILASQNLYLWFVPANGSVSLVTPQQNTAQLTALINAISYNTSNNQTQILNFSYVGYESSTFQRREHQEQFIWGGVMLVIIGGVLGYLFYNSRPQAYDYSII